MSEKENPIYNRVKNEIIKSGRFLRDSDDDLLKQWFFAGVAAVVQIADVKLKKS
jgi:hypothetical protein